MKLKVLLGPSTFGELDSQPIEVLREGGCAVIANPYRRKLTKQELIALLPGVAGLIAGLEIVDRDVMEKSQLKVISRCGSGISNVDVRAADELGIGFYYTPNGPTEAVAELTVGMMVCLLRKAHVMDRALKDRKWEKRIGYQLQGKKVLIVGYGRIGRRLAELLRPFEVEILAVDPALEHEIEDVQLTSLEEALPNADVISIHASGEKRILGEEAFRLLKPGVFICNAARGGLVDEALLKKGLENGLVAGAWLDCFNEEPYSGPLCDAPNVILTPHIGSYAREGRMNMEIEAARNLLRGLQNG